MTTKVGWQNASEVFSLHIGNTNFPLLLIAIMTFVLISSSGTMVMAVNYGYRKDRKLTALMLIVTAVLGATFVGMQVFEWSKLISEGVRPWGNPMGAPQFGGIFFMITGFHGTHVSIGVIFLLVMAHKDSMTANLQRVQMVKAWMEDGKSREQVTDIACSDGLVPDPKTGRCPDNGASVDLKTCEPSVGQGDVTLAVRWRDPQFHPEDSAVYYVRVLENPSCRWTAFDAIRVGIDPPEGARPVIQERAWSSPIWYTSSYLVASRLFLSCVVVRSVVFLNAS